jgi:hypothetical protein
VTLEAPRLERSRAKVMSQLGRSVNGLALFVRRRPCGGCTNSGKANIVPTLMSS